MIQRMVPTYVKYGTVHKIEVADMHIRLSFTFDQISIHNVHTCVRTYVNLTHVHVLFKYDPNKFMSCRTTVPHTVANRNFYFGIFFCGYFFQFPRF